MPERYEGKGIRFVICRKKRSTVTNAQSVLFDASRWSIARAKAWLRRNGFKYGHVEKPTGRGKYYRFRQFDKAQCQKAHYATIFIPRRAMAKKRRKKVKRKRKRNPQPNFLLPRGKKVAPLAPGRKKIRRANRGRRRNQPLYHVKQGNRFFTGHGFTTTPARAAYYKSKTEAARTARALANKIRKPVSVNA